MSREITYKGVTIIESKHLAEDVIVTLQWPKDVIYCGSIEHFNKVMDDALWAPMQKKLVDDLIGEKGLRW